MTNLINPNWVHGLETKVHTEDTRNVIDHYKYWETEAIQADLDAKRTELVILVENFAHDFNISTVVRIANAFVAAKVIIVGRRGWDKRGAVGTHNYEHIETADDSASVIREMQAAGYRVVVADNIPGAQSVENYPWQKKTLLVLGQESIGVSQAAITAADDVVYIPQLGSTRSLNVGTAAAIMTYSYMVSTNAFAGA